MFLRFVQTIQMCNTPGFAHQISRRPHVALTMIRRHLLVFTMTSSGVTSTRLELESTLKQRVRVLAGFVFVVHVIFKRL
jgi:hypothetical protein